MQGSRYFLQNWIRSTSFFGTGGRPAPTEMPGGSPALSAGSVVGTWFKRLPSGTAPTAAEEGGARKIKLTEWPQWVTVCYFFCFIIIILLIILESLQFLNDLGCRIHRATDDPKSYIYLLRCLSISIQRGNSASVLGTVPWLHCFVCLLLFFLSLCVCFFFFL